MLRKLADRFLGRDRKDAEGALAAFGKHPGWDDHIDDLGLDTEALVAAKRILYVEGIAGNIDSGAWEKLAPEHRVERFDHALAWRMGRDLLIGRLWSSSDGKGRTKYPMVLCVHWPWESSDVAIRRVWPLLEAAKDACVVAKTADQVRAAVDRARAQVAQAAAAVGAEATGAAGVDLEWLAARPELGPDALGLLRILYQVERELDGYLPGRSGTRAMTVPTGRHMRVPACSAQPGQDLSMWMSFFETRLAAGAPILVVAPLGQPWLDVLIGQPNRDLLYCLRAGRASVPLSSETPWSMDAQFMERAVAQLGPTGTRIVTPPPAIPPDAPRG